MKHLNQILALLSILVLMIFTLAACKQADNSRKENARQSEEESFADTEKNDVAGKDDLIEDVPEIHKRIVRVKYLYEYEEGTRSVKTEYKYDDTNCITNQYIYDEEGNLLRSAIEERDLNGNVISYTRYDESGDITSREDITYNADGQELTRSCYEANFLNSGETTYILENVYNENGELVKTIRNEEGNFCTQVEYEYENGQRIHSKNYFSDGTLFYETDYVYDKEGNLLEENNKYPETYIGSYLLSKSGSGKTEYEYDENGNKVKELFFKDGKFRESYEYEYDEYDNILMRKILF